MLQRHHRTADHAPSRTRDRRHDRGCDFPDHRSARQLGRRPRRQRSEQAPAAGVRARSRSAPPTRSSCPTGYTARPFIPWGTPILGSYPAFVPGTPPFVPGGNTAAEQAQQIGMHHDGMHFFPLAAGPARQRARAAGASTTSTPTRATCTPAPARSPPTAAWTAGHGPQVPDRPRRHRRRDRARTAPGDWAVVRSRLNRRITANTPMSFSGPAAGHRLVRTSADPRGTRPARHVQQLRPRRTRRGTPT